MLHSGKMQELAEQISKTTRDTSNIRNKMEWNRFNQKTDLLIILWWTWQQNSTKWQWIYTPEENAKLCYRV